MKSLVLFNNKGGVGKTTLTFNLAHMLAHLGLRTVVLDYDPQCNLTSIFLDEDKLDDLWSLDEGLGKKDGRGLTVAACLEDVKEGVGQVLEPVLWPIRDSLWLVPGHLSLSAFEQKLALMWAYAASSENGEAIRVVSSLAQLSHRAAEAVRADMVLIDVGPSLGALNRTAILCCDAVIVPLAPDLFSLQGLKNVGPTLRRWREDWHLARGKARPAVARDAPAHEFLPIGYILQQHLVRGDQPARAYQRWASRIPAVYHEEVAQDTVAEGITAKEDPACVGMLAHYASLVPMAQQARKPLFALGSADGIGSRGYLVRDAKEDFRQIALSILRRMGMPWPTGRA